MPFNVVELIVYFFEALIYLFHLSVLILLIVQRKAAFKGPFYNIFKMVLIADLICYFCSIFQNKLPNIPELINLFSTNTYFVTPITDILSFVSALQFFGHLFIAFNRFTLTWLPLKHENIWKRQWYTLLLIILPFLYVCWRLHEPVIIVYSADKTNFYMSFLSSFATAINFPLSTALYLSTTLFSGIFNFMAFVKFFFLKQNDNYSNVVREKTLLLVSIIIFIAQLLRLSFNFGYFVFRSNPEMMILLNSFLPYLYDIYAWSGSISLMALSNLLHFCAEIRMASSKRKYENLENLEISALWMCTEGDLHSNIMKDDCVKAVPNLPNVKYNFKFYPKLLKNPHVFLSLEMPKNMNIAVNATISCESASYVQKWTHLYTKSDEYWSKICSVDDLLDPNKNFMEELKYVTFWVKATLTIFNANDLLIKKIKTDSLGPKLWENENGKDAKIVVDGKEIKAHKSVLQTRSTMLKSLINFKVKTEPGTKKTRGMSPPISESSSSDLFLINNYGFNIVEKAVLFCYDIPCFDGLSAEDGINLLKFAEEFQMTDLKEKAEEFCIKVLSGSNAYFCVNSSVNVKAEKLYHKCFEFLLKCMKYGTPVKNVDKLNAEMKEKLFAKAFVKA